MSTRRARRFPLAWLVVAAAAWLVLAVAAACSSGGSNTPGQACTPGASASCACPSGGTGAQTCSLDGAGYGACDCSGGSSTTSMSSIVFSHSSSGPQGTSQASSATSGNATTGSIDAGSSVLAQCIVGASPIELSNEPADAGRATCGASNDTVSCGSYTCPKNSGCTGSGCTCDPGYTSYTCAGAPCNGATCAAGEWSCVPVSSCGIEYSPDQSEALYVFTSGPTYVAVRTQPPTSGSLSGSYAPVAWQGKNPFVPPTFGATPTPPSVVAPVDFSHTIAPMCLAYWVMDTRNGKVTNYVSKPGGPKVKISLPVADGGGTGGFSVTFDDPGEPGDGGSAGADLEEVQVDDAGAITSDGGAAVFVAAMANATVSRTTPATAECTGGSGGAACTSFTACDPFAADAGCGGCPSLACAGTNPGGGSVCCTTLGNACSSAADCCGGNSCTAGVCQLSTNASLCIDAGPPPPMTDGGFFQGFCCCASVGPAGGECDCGNLAWDEQSGNLTSYTSCADVCSQTNGASENPGCSGYSSAAPGCCATGTIAGTTAEACSCITRPVFGESCLEELMGFGLSTAVSDCSGY